VDWSPGYREYAPPAALGCALSCVWVSVTPAAGAPPTRILPDACTDLVWRSGTGVSLAGPDTRPVLAASPPGSVIAGVRFRPGAGGPALGLPLSALLDQHLDPAALRAELPGGRGAALVTEVHGGLAPAEAVRRLVRLAGEMVAGAPPDPLVAAAARRLARPGAQAGTVVQAGTVAQARTGVQVSRVAADLGISERQLHRRCVAAVGYGPVLLRRVLRFRRFVSRIDTGGAWGDLAGLAAEAGYADQAHLTRESRELAGLPPAALARLRRPGGAGQPQTGLTREPA
jgi:AraC-like DNA-binding protein